MASGVSSDPSRIINETELDRHKDTSQSPVHTLTGIAGTGESTIQSTSPLPTSRMLSGFAASEIGSGALLAHSPVRAPSHQTTLLVPGDQMATILERALPPISSVSEPNDSETSKPLDSPATPSSKTERGCCTYFLLTIWEWFSSWIGSCFSRFSQE